MVMKKCVGKIGKTIEKNQRKISMMDGHQKMYGCAPPVRRPCQNTRPHLRTPCSYPGTPSAEDSSP